MNPLEQLTAALMEVDGSVIIVERTERAMQLKAGAMNVVLLDVVDLASFEADARAVNDAVKPGTSMMIVGIDRQRLGAAAVLERVVPSTLTQVRSQRLAWLWVPGEKPQSVRGVAWASLNAAVKAIDEGRVGDPAIIIARRAQQSDDVQLFMQPLMQRKPVVTFGIAALSVAIFALQMIWGSGEPYVAAKQMGAGVPSLVFAGEWWRLLAPMLLHGSVLHVAMNMIALLSFGTFLERFLGWRRYLLLYVLSGLGGSIASTLRPTDVISVGASGGMWGLMIAGAVLVTWPRGLLPVLVSHVQKKRAWAPVALNAVISFQPGIDWLAHAGGGIVGGLLVFTGLITAGIPAAEKSNDPEAAPLREGVGVKVAAVVAGLALIASLGVAFAMGRPWRVGALELGTVSFGAGVTGRLPLFDTKPELKENGITWTYGALRENPVAFVVVLPEAELSEAEVADPKAALAATVPTFDPGVFEGFTVQVKSELRELDGRPYIFHRQVASDGRAGDTYFIVDGKRMATVMVLTNKRASAEWRNAAEAAPFSLKLAQ